MAPRYELIYFNIRGLAEMERLLFADLGIEFIDTRIAGMEEWQSIKSQFNFGQVPCLKDGDKQIVQSGAIMRHLARTHNLYGRDEDDQCYVDMFFEGVRDLHAKYAALIYREYEIEGKKEEFLQSTLPTALAQIEKLFVSRQNGEHFVLGETLSFADYALFEVLDILTILDAHSLDNFAALKAFHKRFEARPSLKAYLEARRASGVKVNNNGKQ